MFAIGDTEWAGLSKLIEEAGEVIQVGGKLMGSRGETNHWSGNLREKFIEELGDLLAAIAFFGEQNLTEDEREEVLARMEKKMERFAKWHFDKDPLPEENNEPRSD
jgi:NTP pyrophosphatase (non-canonical NTP hydrolase)